MLIYKQNNLIIYYNREFCNQNIKFQITDTERFTPYLPDGIKQ